MKKIMALAATALVLVGCSKSDRTGMGSPSSSQTGSEQTPTSGSYGTAPGQRGSTNNISTNTTTTTSGSSSTTSSAR